MGVGLLNMQIANVQIANIEIINSLFLLLLRALELFAIDYFLAGVETRRKYLWMNTALNFVFASLMIAARYLVYMIPGIESEFFYITFAYYFLVYLFLLIKYKISSREAAYDLLLIFLCVHVLRQTVGRVARSLHGINPLTYMTAPAIPLRILYTIIYFILCCVTYYVIKKRIYYNKEKTWEQIIWLLIAIVPVMYLTNIGLVMGIDQALSPLSAAIVAQVCSYSGLVILVGYDNTLALNEKKQEIIRMESMLKNQMDQYKLRQETVDILNKRYHDFKNQIMYLDIAGPSAVQKAYLKGIEDDIRRYDMLYRTGNEALDIILTNKGMDCAKKDIRLLLLMDGSLFNFMKPMDLVALFSNAIDNAVEALETVAPNRRDLIIRTTKTEGWIVLRFENEYATELKWRGGKLLSTKEQNAELHGQGISIIENTANEYGGNISIDANESQARFALNILFPVSSADE